MIYRLYRKAIQLSYSLYERLYLIFYRLFSYSQKLINKLPEALTSAFNHENPIIVERNGEQLYDSSEHKKIFSKNDPS